MSLSLEAIINVLKSSYLQAVSEAYTDEESQYVHKLRCYQKLLGSDLPLEYIAHTLKDMRQIYLSERCFDAFATAVFSARSEEANGLRVSLVMRITDMVWKSAEIKVKLTWLRCLARADEKSIIGPFLREKLNSLPDIDLPLQGAYHPAISGLANGGAGVAVSSHAPGGSPSP
ncbi:MAG: hypothetical protein K0Q57_209 [Gammaproteobacteria bacterium]|nr:hypothetical protein [Gammaproteobacteria bacterium]